MARCYNMRVKKSKRFHISAFHHYWNPAALICLIFFILLIFANMVASCTPNLSTISHIFWDRSASTTTLNLFSLFTWKCTVLRDSFSNSRWSLKDTTKKKKKLTPYGISSTKPAQNTTVFFFKMKLIFVDLLESPDFSWLTAVHLLKDRVTTYQSTISKFTKYQIISKAKKSVVKCPFVTK